MKIFGLLFGILFSFSFLKANESDIRKKDSSLANTYFDLAWKYRSIYSDSSYIYANKSLEISEKNNFIQLEAYSLGRIGEYYRNIELYAKANYYLTRSLEIRITSNDTGDIFNGYINLGNLFLYQEEYDSSIFYFGEVLKYGGYNKFLTQQAKALNGLSMAYMNIRNYDLAEISLNRALDIGFRENDSLGVAKRYQNLGVFYEKIERHNFALKNFNLANSIYEALNNEEGIIDIQINIASILLYQRNYKAAIEQLKIAEEKSYGRGFLKKRLTILNNLGFAYQALNQLDKAQENYEEGFSFAQKNDQGRSIVEIGINQAYLLKEQKRYHQLLEKLIFLENEIIQRKFNQFLYHVFLLRADALAGLGQYEEAFQERLQFFEQQDSLGQKIDHAQVLAAEIEQTKSEQALLKERNEHQETEILKQKAENKVQTISIWALSIFLVAVSVILSLRLRNVRIKSRALEDKKKSEEELFSVLQKVDIQILEKQIEAKEKASIKIGQDLHDNLGSKLAVVQMLYDGISCQLESANPDIEPRIKKIGTLIEESCDDMRNVAHDLIDLDVRNKGFINELKQYFSLLDGVNDMKFNFNPVEDLSYQLSVGTEKDILAIIRLLTENILRHASAKEVLIFVHENENVLKIEIEDNGIGFDVSQILENGGKGLKNAKDRTHKFGGSFSIESNASKGTKALITIPFNKNRV